MPLNIWTRDQVPELMLRGAQGLGGGIAGAGASLGDAIGKRLEESKRLNTAGGAAKKFLDALIDASGDDDTTKKMRREANKSQSSRQAIAEMTGIQQAQGYATAQAHFKEALEHAAGLKATRENQAKAPAFYKRLLEAGAPPEQVPSPLSNSEFDRRTAPQDARAVFEAAASTGFDPGTHLSDLAQIIKQSNPGMDLATAFAMARNPPEGYERGGVQIGYGGTPAVNFTPTPAPQPTPVIPADLNTKTVVVGPEGKTTTTYGLTDKAKTLTDAQANGLQFSDRMKFNNTIIDHLEKQGFSPATVGGAVQGALPNYLSSEASQQYQAAARNWVSAVLRKESGAAISKSEETAAMKQYFPALGDGPSVIQQKGALRRLAEENMRRAIGSIDESPSPKTPRAGLAPPSAAGSTNRVMVTDGTNKFWLPASQLQDAVKQGYQQVQ